MVIKSISSNKVMGVYQVASLADRILARLIDIGILLVIYLLILLIGVIGMDGYGNMAFGLPVLTLIFLCLFGFYDIVVEIITNGQSAGKKVMKIKVISLNGANVSIKQYLIRWVFRSVDFLITLQLGALFCVVFTKNNQRIGDVFAGTALIKKDV